MYEACIGLEIHVELKTKSKAFCSCAVSFGERANKNVCPVCMGLPGALPVLNKKVVEYAVRLGLALNCRVNTISEHARKNYFYPDLPKGYQISQGERPVCTDGYVETDGRKIRINRIHIEEDAGKLVHSEGETLVDYNRSGVPLLEIVTEPDIRSAQEAKSFLEYMKNMFLSLGISECKMQRGNLRCDVNVSVRKKGEDGLGERCEMKNVNSFSQAVRSIEYEIKRQTDIKQKGGAIVRETRRWDDEAQKSILMRKKEKESDYRYFPEPDLPPIEISDEMLGEITREMPELFWEKAERYQRDYGLSEYDAKSIATDITYARLLDAAVKTGADAKLCANLILGDVSRMVNARAIESDEIPFDGERLAQLAELIEKKQISYTAAGKVVEIMFEDDKPPYDIVKEKNLLQISGVQELGEIVKKVIAENEKSVADYRKGKTNAMGYLVGRCMKMSGGKANPNVVSELLKSFLEVGE